MTEFDYRMNLLQAEIERGLGDRNGFQFWSGYIQGLRRYRDFHVVGDPVDGVFEATSSGPLFFRRAGYRLGILGKNVFEAAEMLDRNPGMAVVRPAVGQRGGCGQGV